MAVNLGRFCTASFSPQLPIVNKLIIFVFPLFPPETSKTVGNFSWVSVGHQSRQWMAGLVKGKVWMKTKTAKKGNERKDATLFAVCSTPRTYLLILNNLASSISRSLWTRFKFTKSLRHQGANFRRDNQLLSLLQHRAGK